MSKRFLLWVMLAAAATVQAETNPDDVVITRGGVSVTLLDVDNYVARVPKEQRGRFIDSPTRIRDMLNNILLTKKLAEQARAEHLDRKPEIERQLRTAQDEVLARARMAEFIDSIKVPDLSELAREEYVTHKDVYKLAPQVDVKHLLITTEKRSDAEAAALAGKLRAEALANPKDFDALIAKYSEDASKAGNSGLISDATSKKYVEEFRDAADALMQPGEISPLVHTKFGYHVLQLVERRPERQQTFDEVRERLVASVREQFIANQRRDFVNQLTNEKDEINPATMDTLRDRYDAEGNVRTVAGAGKPASAAPTQQRNP